MGTGRSVRAAGVRRGGGGCVCACPGARAIERSHSLLDWGRWAACGRRVQLASYAAVRFLRRHDLGGVEAGDMAEATLLACASVGLGLLNAACLT